MPVFAMSFVIADDTLNGRLNVDDLNAEIDAEHATLAFGFAPLANPTSRTGANFRVRFVDTLSGADQTRVTNVVAAHQGDPVNTPLDWLTFHEPLHVSAAGFAVVAAPTYRPGFRLAELSLARIRIVGSHNTNGGTSDIELVEVDPDGVAPNVTLINTTLPDVVGAWTGFSVISGTGGGTTAEPRAGRWEYRLRTRLGASVSSSVRRMALVLRRRQPST